MRKSERLSWKRWLRPAGSSLLLAGLAVPGCSPNQQAAEKPVIKPRYETLPAREGVPAWMKGTVYEYCNTQNIEPYPVSAFGLVVGLNNTGDNTGAPLSVRNYLIDEMVKHGLGSKDERLEKYKPERILEDKQTAIVEIYGLLPPGAREGQRMDVYVRAIDGSGTTSLARGVLWERDLKHNGANRMNPKGAINVLGRAWGPVFVNPAFAAGDADKSQSKASLRSGTIMNGGVVAHDRPIFLRVRQPQLSLARTIEMRIDQRFEDSAVSRTQDEGRIAVFVPPSFNGDWEHFMGVVNHLYLNGSPGFAAVKARELAEEAVKPGALLKDISYCWEGLGAEALPFIQPLYGNPSADVAYAAARAGAFIRDAAAEEALLAMAVDDRNPFQVNAVQTLGALPSSTRLHRMLAQVLSSKNALARIEAYHVLAEHQSPLIISNEVRGMFLVDRVICDGPPLVYATRSGVPRIALIGREMGLNLPIMFSALNNKLTISTPPDARGVTVFDRTGDKVGGVQMRMGADLHEIVTRLGGVRWEDGVQYGYSDLVGVLKGLADGRHVPAQFVLQDVPELQDAIEDAPPLPSPDLVEEAGVPESKVPGTPKLGAALGKE